jgi:predicted nucleotidyltransferase
VLFGSTARGDYDSGSDIDIAVIIRGFNREIKNRIFEVVANIEFKFFDPVINHNIF